MTLIIAAANQKGGGGKTATTVDPAARAADLREALNRVAFPSPGPEPEISRTLRSIAAAAEAAPDPAAWRTACAAAAADLIASSGCALTIKPGRGDVWQAAVRSDDAPAHVWDTTVALPPDVAGTMPAWAGPDRLRAWLADLFGPVAAARADLGAAGADDTNTEGTK
uniref:VirC1 protein n=1 Tax=Siphoviridae sp. ctZF426 TaxID=2827580 RepID=A0A8S5RSX9_9CAUD|nr:MAG TPA: VirC1 protein [Siphoviridae sp. ctZF426]